VARGWAPGIPTGIGALAVAALAFSAGFVRLRRTACARCAATGWLLVPVTPPERAPGNDATRGESAATGTVTGRRGFLAAAGAVAASAVATIGAGFGGFVARFGPWRPVARNIFFAEVERTAPVQRPEWAGATVKSYRALGRTGAWVSDISLGSGAID